jgi:putative membrane protein
MWGGGNWMFGGLMMVVFWGLVIGLIVLAVRGFSGRSDTTPPPNALDILRERYAKGEIDEDEYERRKAKLES